MIELLTREELARLHRAYLSSLRPDLLTGMDTDTGAMMEALADAHAGIHANLYALWLDMFPSTDTSTEALERHAEAHLGANPRRPATKAIQGVATIATGGLVIKGTAGSVVSIGDTLVHADGTRYTIITAGTVPVGGSGWACRIESIDTGTICNKESGEVLDFESPPSGVESEVTITSNLTGGYDEETDAELLNRLLDVIRNPHAGGRASDYRQWAMTVPGVAGAYVYVPSSTALTGRRGLGTVDVAILQAGTSGDREPLAALVADVETAIEEVRPACADVHVLTPADQTQVWDVRVLPGVGYDWDWTTTSSWTVSAYDPVTRKLTWNATLPTTLVAGDRILCKGQVMTVQSTSGADTILTEDFEFSPSSSDPIYPAGPLTEPILQAIKDYMDTLGPARGTAADPEQSWEDTIYLSTAYKIIMSVPGVRNVTIVTPSANVTPVDHGIAGTVDFLCYLLTGLTVRPL